jgi:hypothetical protein
MWALLSRVTRIISMSESADFKREFLAALCGKTLHLMLRILHVDIHTQNIPIDTSAPEGEKRVLIDWDEDVDSNATVALRVCVTEEQQKRYPTVFKHDPVE